MAESRSKEQERFEGDRLTEEQRKTDETTHENCDQEQVSILERALEVYGVHDAGGKAVMMTRYLEILRKRRAWAGLSSTSLSTDPYAAVQDSLEVLSVVRCGTVKKVADLGSGGGLVGVVLAIACEEWSVTLVESGSRKSAVLAEVVGALGLANVEVYNDRAESLVGSREFEVVVSRAAGRLEKISPVAIGLLERGGRYVALKGSGVDREIKEAMPVLEALGARLIEVAAPLPEGSPGLACRVSLVVIDKI